MMLPDGTVDDDYSDESGEPVYVTATGGSGSYTFSCDPSTLPPGLDMSPAGLVFGTPSEEGDYTLDVTVEDSSSTQGAAPQQGNTDNKKIPLAVVITPDCGKKGDLYSILDPNINNTFTAAQIKASNPSGTGHGRSILEVNNQAEVPATFAADKDSNGKYVGKVCIPRLLTTPATCYIARIQVAPEKPWTTNSGTAYITAKTIDDVTVHETGHVKVFQSSGKRVSKHYGENVTKIRTKPCDTSAEAKARAKQLERTFFQDCNNEFGRINIKYTAWHDLALPIPRLLNGGPAMEWYIPHPDWFTDRGVAAAIEQENVNAQVPADN